MIDLQRLYGLLNQTTITIPVDLATVRSIRPGDGTVALMADYESTEVYVVRRDRDGKPLIDIFVIHGDRLGIMAHDG